MLTIFMKGMGLGAGLIVAIGSQNAHVLRAGLLRQHVAATVATCMLCEALLIGAGVAGMGSLLQEMPQLLAIARWGGSAFLAWYGLRAWRRAFDRQVLQSAQDAAAVTLKHALASVLAVTLLNPHVYLDTVLLLGAVGGQHQGSEKWWFALGAIAAAFIWFPMLGYGARLLAPWFARPLSWRLLDAVVGTVMLAIAASLAADAVGG